MAFSRFDITFTAIVIGLLGIFGRFVYGLLTGDAASAGELLRWGAYPLLALTALALAASVVVGTIAGTAELAKGIAPVVRVWDLASGRQLAELRGERAAFTTLALSPRGELLAAEDGRILRVWRVSSGQRLCAFDAYRFLGFSGDGRHVLGMMWKSVYLWDAQTGERLRKLEATDTILAAAMAPDGETLAAASADGVVRVWAPSSGSDVGTCAVPGARALALATGGLLAVASDAGQIELRSLPSGELHRSLPIALGAAPVVVLSADGGMLAAATAGGDVVVLRTSTGEQHARFTGVAPRIVSLAFSPDGSALLALGTRTVAWFDLARRVRTAAASWRARGPAAIGFAQDGAPLLCRAGRVPRPRLPPLRV